MSSSFFRPGRRRRGRLAALACVAGLAVSGLVWRAGPAYALATPYVTSVSPSSGPASGGNTLTISFVPDAQGCAGQITAVNFSSGPPIGTVAVTPASQAGSTLTVTAPAEPAGTVAAIFLSDGCGTGDFNFPADEYTWTAAAPPCPVGAKPNVRWHYSAGSSAGSWSATTAFACPGSLSMGPQAMEGDLKVTPGTTIRAGYDFTLPGNKQALNMTVSSAQVSFAVTCASGAAPSAPSFTIAMPDQAYAITGSAWVPSADQSSSLTYQGSGPVPDLCGGGQLDLARGGTFTATLS